MMEDGGDTNDIQSSPAAEDIDLNDEQREDKSIVSQNSDDSSSMSSKVLNAAASAGKTIVDLSVSAAKATEDTIHKVAASADEVLHSHSHPHSHPHEGEDASSSTSSPSNLKETHEEIKEQQQEEEGAVQQEPVTTKVLHAASAAGKTVVDLSISAAKMTGDALHKVVESASEVIHKQKSSGEEKEIASTEAAAQADTADDTQNEGNPTQEPVTTKVLHVASAAGKTVVDLSKSAAKLTGEVIHKVVESAGEVLHKDSKSSPGPNDGDSEPQAAPLPLTTEAIEDESTEKSEKVANPPAEESHGGRMWSSVRRMSEKVISTTSNTISKAAAAVQQQNQQHHHHHHQQQQHQSNDEDTKPEADAHNTDASESERSRSGSMTNQLWSSVKKTADTIADSASAAYKAAEPVAISTASKVSHGAQTVWSTTKEKVFPSKKPSSEDSAEGDAQVEGSSTEAKEEEKQTHHQHSSDNPDGAVNENDVAVEVDTKPAYVASAEPQIVSSHVQGVPAVEDVSTADGHGHGDGEGEGEKEESSSS